VRGKGDLAFSASFKLPHTITLLPRYFNCLEVSGGHKHEWAIHLDRHDRQRRATASRHGAYIASSSRVAILEDTPNVRYRVRKRLRGFGGD
jgi:hypothetical protein